MVCVGRRARAPFSGADTNGSGERNGPLAIDPDVPTAASAAVEPRTLEVGVVPLEAAHWPVAWSAFARVGKCFKLLG